MSETTAIATRDNMSVVSRIGEFNQIADVFAKSGLFPDIKSQGQAFVKILAGAEIGLPPFTSMNAFYIYSGRVTMYANTIAARIKTSGRYNYHIVEKTSTKCTIEFYEAGKLALTETWTTERAAKAGTQNMAKYPDAMLFARCITSGARAVCPEVVGAFYAPEELGAVVNADGEIIDVPAAQQTEPVKPTAPPPAPDDQHALNQRRLGRDQDNIDLSEPAVPPEPNKKQLALSRLSKHARGVGELANQAASSGDSIRANNLIAAVNRARRLYGDMNATISDLHKMADELKALEQPAEVPQM